MNQLFCVLSFIIFTYTVSIDALAQCDSRVSAKTITVSETKGEVEVEVITTERFICKLNIVSGSGITEVNRQTGNNSSSFKFINVDIDKIYQIDVEFTTEEKQLCKRLQRNDLIFESR